MARELKPAVAYLRTSSAANVGADKDSDKRQRAAIEAFAKRAGFTIVDEYYDKAVSGADRIDERPGFRAMLQRLAANGAKTILVGFPIGSRVTSLCSSPDMTCQGSLASRLFLHRPRTSSPTPAFHQLTVDAPAIFKFGH